MPCTILLLKLWIWLSFPFTHRQPTYNSLLISTVSGFDPLSNPNEMIFCDHNLGILLLYCLTASFIDARSQNPISVIYEEVVKPRIHHLCAPSADDGPKVQSVSVRPL